MIANRSRWTVVDDRAITGLLRQGWRPSSLARELAPRLGRSAGAIDQRARILIERMREDQDGPGIVAEYVPIDESADPPDWRMSPQVSPQMSPPISVPSDWRGTGALSTPAPDGPMAHHRTPDETSHRVLAISDLHAPAIHARALDHCLRVQDHYRCDTVVFLGDVADLHALSRYDHDPDLPNAGGEFDAARNALRSWFDEFPTARICVGNHDDRLSRKLYQAGIPASAGYAVSALLGCPPGWRWAASHEIDGVLYVHGDGAGGGINGPRLLAQRRGTSTVIGHWHHNAGVSYTPTHDGALRWGMGVGCLIAHEHPCMSYARTQGHPALGCGVVLDGTTAIYIPLGGAL